MSTSLAVLYVNGLGNGEPGRFDGLLKSHWGKAGATFVFASVNWYDGANLESKIQQVANELKDLLTRYEKVILLGSSAGASLALNVFARNKQDNIYVINAHGRLKKGNIRWPDYRTLEWAAHLRYGIKPASKVFYDSVMLCDTKTLPSLTAKDKKRILVLKPPIDFIVPIKTMNIPGAKNCMTLLPGHKGAGISHLFFCRNLILDFARA